MRSRPERRIGDEVQTSGAGLGEIPVSAGRRPRAGYASRHSGGSGAPPAGHYELAARSSLTVGRKCSADPKGPRKARPGAGHRFSKERRWLLAARGAPRGGRVIARRAPRLTSAELVWMRLLALRPLTSRGGKGKTADPAPANNTGGEALACFLLPAQRGEGAERALAGAADEGPERSVPHGRPSPGSPP